MNVELLLGFRKIKGISNYQFGKDITEILFNKSEMIRLERSRKTDKIRYIYEEDNLLLTLRPTNGFFTLSFHSAQKIIRLTKPPRLRVIVLTEISDFIKMGRNVFCKHVIDIDEELRPMDEVIIVNEADELLAIGRLKIPVVYIKDLKSGIAINVRKGVNKSKN